MQDPKTTETADHVPKSIKEFIHVHDDLRFRVHGQVYGVETPPPALPFKVK